MSFRAIVGSLGGVALGLLASRLLRPRGGSPRQNNLRSLAFWAVLTLVGLAVWVLASTRTEMFAK